jgi:exopolysaccharide production repressor protein
MSLPRFLVGMLCVLVVFALTTYLATHSLWTTLFQTLVCAILIQLGYFGAVLFLVRRTKKETPPSQAEIVRDAPALSASEERPSVKPGTLPEIGRPRHF